ncbi:hypothetical protein M9H77_30285 [Catharanthus roseus]|uniref:Uncharacterized protein n=1 Tax=Catharanthus roseus TaxID=4058 RepID=A0ACB9ZWT1_CATRO|nr:hypothetical protein M9H77_30285 [Catharanthus roseus]
MVKLHLKRCRRKQQRKDIQKVGYYDPIKNQTYLNVLAILYFLEKSAQPTGTVQDILKNGRFKEFHPNQMKFN